MGKSIVVASKFTEEELDRIVAMLAEAGIKATASY